MNAANLTFDYNENSDNVNILTFLLTVLRLTTSQLSCIYPFIIIIRAIDL